MIVAIVSRRVSGDDLEFFESRVRPLLVERCFQCHGPDVVEPKGGLRIHSRGALLEGGESGPAVDPEDLGGSLLLQAIRYDGAFEMPPDSKLPDDEIDVLTRWVTAGAAMPDLEQSAATLAAKQPFDLQTRRDQHWCWRPVASQVAPSVQDSGWPKDRCDAFVLQKLESAGVHPAQEAAPAAWLRRVYFDLVGLPPAPEDLEEFLADSPSGRKERAVDRLLASPRFGEHWARHWLDLVRYAESYGHEFDNSIPHAYHYRDYVIRALNADVPFDQFTREHIAGDLLPAPRRNPEEGYDESVVGSGFWFLHEATHGPVDVLRDQASHWENRIDVLCKTFLGLTVACARCHDHKFDAISTNDYYALVGVLKGTRRQLAMLDPRETIARTASTIRDRIATDLPPLRYTPVAHTQSSFVEVSREETTANPAAEPTAGNVFATFGGEDWGDWKATGLAFGRRPTQGGEWEWLDTPRPIAAGIAHSGLLGKEFQGVLRSPTFIIQSDAIHFLVRGSGARIRVMIDGYDMDVYNAILFSGLIVDVETKGEWKWLSAAGDLVRYRGHEAHVELLDESSSGFLAVDAIEFDDRKEHPAVEEEDLSDLPPSDIDSTPDGETIARLRALAAGVPAPILAQAACEGSPTDQPLQIRGNPQTLGAPVPRQFLQALGGIPLGNKVSSGRLELAHAISAADNPLTSRVYVNRVWQHLFGEGLVATSDNFGQMGAIPSHAELLDDLADRFVRDGWSTKRLIRRLVLSSTYGQGSTVDPVLEVIDPKNRLLHRMRPRRLSGESLRDTLLWHAGKLDLSAFGPSVPVHLTAFMTGRGRPETSGPLDGAGRRSIYLEIRRNFLNPLMLAFDTPIPFNTVGRRHVSNVPAQGLILMNDPFVWECCAAWADKLWNRFPANGDDNARIERLYVEAYARHPTDDECEMAVSFLANQRAALAKSMSAERSCRDAWRDLCQVIVNTKEFLFIP